MASADESNPMVLGGDGDDDDSKSVTNASEYYVDDEHLNNIPQFVTLPPTKKGKVTITKVPPVSTTTPPPPPPATPDADPVEPNKYEHCLFVDNAVFVREPSNEVEVCVLIELAQMINCDALTRIVDLFLVMYVYRHQFLSKEVGANIKFDISDFYGFRVTKHTTWDMITPMVDQLYISREKEIKKIRIPALEIMKYHLNLFHEQNKIKGPNPKWAESDEKVLQEYTERTGLSDDDICFGIKKRSVTSLLFSALSHIRPSWYVAPPAYTAAITSTLVSVRGTENTIIGGGVGGVGSGVVIEPTKNVTTTYVFG